MDKVFNIMTLIVIAAIITSLVAHKGTATVVNALGNSFTGAIKAATGR